MSVFSGISATSGHTKGIRRTIKVYGLVDPAMEERRRQREATGPIRRPHAALKTSVRDIKGQRGL